MKRPFIRGAITGLFVFSFLLIAYVFTETADDTSNEPAVSKPQIKEHNVQTSTVNNAPEKLIEYPFGGRSLFPENRIVALYGSPLHSSLGVLGEQDLPSSINRIKTMAAEYQELSDENIIPAFEIITTIAAAEPTPNNDYSRETKPEKLIPWINAAKENDIYIVLDLQPGRSTFLQQIKLYEKLLIEPHVGIALDPEWRLQNEKDRHLVSVGSVSAAEINETSQWLAKLTAQHKLPQKLFIVHQFKPSMITERETLDTSRKELAYMVHMDGHGALNSKTGTWNRIKENLPNNVYLGWKNFYDEDKPTPSPEQTMQQIPKPWLVTYQ